MRLLVSHGFYVIMSRFCDDGWVYTIMGWVLLDHGWVLYHCRLVVSIMDWVLLDHWGGGWGGDVMSLQIGYKYHGWVLKY